MDQYAPREDSSAKPVKSARTALGVLALCFALSVLGRGLGESFTVFLKPISEDFGWDRAQVVSLYSLSALAGGLASPFIGRLFDRSGPRSVYALGLILLGGAFLIAAHAQYLWQFQLSLGLYSARPLVRAAIAHRDGGCVLRNRRGCIDSVADLAALDRSNWLARRLSGHGRRGALSAVAAVAVAMAAVLRRFAAFGKRRRGRFHQ
jgi:MFS family permease